MVTYRIVNMNGQYWNGARWSSWWWDYKEFNNKGAVVACMRMLKRMGYKCYYERY